MRKKICVVGGGVAGFGVADGLLERNFTDFTLLEGRPIFLYTLTWLKFSKKKGENISGEFSGNEFRDYLLGRERPEENFIKGNRVFYLDKKKKKLYFSDGKETADCEFDKLILATGGVPVLYGEYLLPGFRGAGIFTAYQVGEMLTHYDFLPGEKLIVYGRGEYAAETALLAKECGLDVKIVFSHEPDFHLDFPFLLGKIVKVHGGLRVSGVDVRTAGNEVEELNGDTLVVAGKYVLERGWREIAGIKWDIDKWRGISDDPDIILVGDAFEPSFNFVRQYEESYKKGMELANE